MVLAGDKDCLGIVWRSLRQCITNFIVFCFVMCVTSAISFADEEAILTSKINEENTQLRTWFKLREQNEPVVQFSVGLGYRNDNIKWSVANDSVDIASELNWNETGISQLLLGATVFLDKHWFLKGGFATGVVVSGNNRDSDYAGSNRTQEFSRSDSKSGGATWDYTIAFGPRLDRFELSNEVTFYISPMIGYSYNQQDLTIFDGEQKIPFSVPLTGLNNHYDARWMGPWFGFEILLVMYNQMSLVARTEIHSAEFSAQANWNLRNDFMHPVSFEHDATGAGLVNSISLFYNVSRNFLINSRLGYQTWNAQTGEELTYFSSGVVEKRELKRIEWDSMSISFGALYQF